MRAALSTLRRSDQRGWARLYLDGLLDLRERRTISRIAHRAGAGQVGQSLHHFISKSPWDWERMRAELARFLHGELAPPAWVVDSVVIPKAGEHSVGVDVSFVPELGRRISHQRAVGLWFASEHGSVPVHWRLMLPERWTDDAALRYKTGVPETAEPDLLEAGLGLVHDVGSEWGIPPRPVVLDGRGYAAERLLHRLARTGTPYVARIAGDARFGALHPAAVRYGNGAASARRLVDLVKGLRTPTGWRAGDGTVRTSLALGTPVAPLYGNDGSTARPLTLVGEWRSEDDRDPALWVSNLPGIPARSVLRMGHLLDTVRPPAPDSLGASALHDFEGRSFPGWHHHATLVSVACAVRALSAGTGPDSHGARSSPARSAEAGGTAWFRPGPARC
ncbi:hypothetical protein A6A08_19185 [Nocardiopsis sp. TSRI0078]|nr:hypothetical protein A6A08_19185 [Nocardiopsis sp. TSRI0078]